MKVHIRKDIRLQGTDAELKDYLKALLTMVNPAWLDAKNFGRWTGNIPQYIYQFEEWGSDITIPRGMLDHLLNDLGREWEEVVDERVAPKAAEDWPAGNIVLRNDQEPLVRELLSHESGFLAAPPGSGKTVMGLEAARRLGLRALWLTHRNELKEQTILEAVVHLEIPKERIGIIHGKQWEIGDQLTIGMVPTLSRRDLSSLEEEFGVVIVDEAHHVPSRTFLQVVNQFASQYMYGLTATAYRRDQLESIMFNSVGPVTARVGQAKLVEDEHLIKPMIRQRSTGWIPPPAEALGIVGRDLGYHDYMKAMVHDNARNRLIVGDVTQECRLGNVCIVLVGRTTHAEILTQLIQEQGVDCEFVVGSVDVPPDPKSKPGKKRKKRTMSKEVRSELIARLKSGKLQTLVATYGLLAEGFNHRPLNRLFLATPGRWKGGITQAIGRVQRTAEGKVDAIVYDYVDWRVGMFARQAEARIASVYEEGGMRVEVM